MTEDGFEEDLAGAQDDVVLLVGEASDRGWIRSKYEHPRAWFDCPQSCGDHAFHVDISSKTPEHVLSIRSGLEKNTCWSGEDY